MKNYIYALKISDQDYKTEDFEFTKYIINDRYSESLCERKVKKFIDINTCVCVIPSSSQKVASPALCDIAKTLFGINQIAPFIISEPITSAKGCNYAQRRYRWGEISAKVHVDTSQLKKYKKVILFDDVFTSGVTIDVYADLLEKEGIEVLKVSVAKTFSDFDATKFQRNFLLLHEYNFDFKKEKLTFCLEPNYGSFTQHFGKNIIEEKFRKRLREIHYYTQCNSDEISKLVTHFNYYFPQYLKDDSIFYLFYNGNYNLLYKNIISISTIKTNDGIEQLKNYVVTLNKQEDVFLLKESGAFALDMFDIINNNRIKVIYVKDQSINTTKTLLAKELEDKILENGGMIVSVIFPQEKYCINSTEQLLKSLLKKKG